MQRYGRRVGFFIGAPRGGAGRRSAHTALWTSSFLTVPAGSATSPASTCRRRVFTALPPPIPLRTRSGPRRFPTSWRAGWFRRVIGPQLVKLTADAMVVPFLGTYLAVIAINLVGIAPVPVSRHPQTGAAPRPRQPARRAARLRAVATPAHRRGDHLRDGLLRADEPGDDLDAAGGGRLRLRPRAMPPISSRRMCWRCSRRRSLPAT